MAKKQTQPVSALPDPSPKQGIDWPWLRPRILFWGYVVAAIGVMVYAVKFRGTGFTVQELQPYVFNLMGLGGVLFLFEVILKIVDKYKAPPLLKQIAGYSLFGLGFLALLSVVVWFSYGMLRHAGLVGTPLRPPPNPIPFVTAPSYRSDNLPDAIFGSKTDEAAKHRQWMDFHEKGAASHLKNPNARFFWLLTKPFGGATAPYTAHVYVNTTAPVAVDAWIVSPRSKDQLPQASGQGLSMSYLYNVRETEADERLLVFIAIDPKDFENIDAVNKLEILSQPRSTSTE